MVFTRFLPISWTSPYTVQSTSFPLLTPSCLMRYFSSSTTAAFIHSADFKTNGRMSSPAPNLSPTSFIAGKSTSFRVCTAASWAIVLGAFKISFDPFVPLSPLGTIFFSLSGGMLSEIAVTTSSSIPSLILLTILK